MSVSSSSTLEAESDRSQSRSVEGSSVLPGAARNVVAKVGPVLEDDAVAAADADVDADVDANEDPTLGGCGSGVMLVKRVSHAAPPSGLRLRSRSPSPSKRSCLIICRDLSRLFDARFRACTLSDSVDVIAGFSNISIGPE